MDVVTRDKTSDHDRSRRTLVAALILLLIIAAYLLPIWSVAHFPSQDGPEHVYNATVLREYHWPGREQFQHYFRLNHRPVPNWAAAILLRCLLAVAPPAVADKLVVSGFVIFFFIAGGYAVRAANPTAGPGVLLILAPLAYNEFLFLGFHNFFYSIPVLLLILGYCTRHANDFCPRHAAVLSLLSVVLYFCHIVTFGIEGVYLSLLAVCFAAGFGENGGAGDGALPAQESRAPVSHKPTARRLARAAMPLAALIPGLALSALFLSHQPMKAATGLPLGKRLREFFTWWQPFPNWDGRYSGILSLLLLVVSIKILVQKFRAKAGFNWGDLLLPTALLTAAADLVVPDEISGGSYVVSRVNVLARVCWVLWLAIESPRVLSVRLRRGVYVAAGLAASLMLIADFRSMHRVEDYIEEFVSAGVAIRPNATILSVAYTPVGFDREDRPINFRAFCLLHADGWIAQEKRAVQLTDYEAGTGYFPVLFRHGLDAKVAAAQTPAAFEQIDRFKDPVDDVIVWTGNAAPPAWVSRELLPDLAAHFHLIYCSPGRGYVRVYERNGLTPLPAPLPATTRLPAAR